MSDVIATWTAGTLTAVTTLQHVVLNMSVQGVSSKLLRAPAYYHLLAAVCIADFIFDLSDFDNIFRHFVYLGCTSSLKLYFQRQLFQLLQQSMKVGACSIKLFIG